MSHRQQGKLGKNKNSLYISDFFIFFCNRYEYSSFKFSDKEKCNII